MWDSVRDNWVRFNEPLEGVLSFMYLDRRNLVTTAMGNLIDPFPLALQLTWLDESGGAVSRDAISAEWETVKSRTDLSQLGGRAFAPPITSLHIDDHEIIRVVTQKLQQNEDTLTARAEFADFPNWPADAQFGLLSMAWALGPAFHFPNFQAAAADGNWNVAATECIFGPHEGTIEQRNAMDQRCFTNAQQAVTDDLDPSVLLIAS